MSNIVKEKFSELKEKLERKHYLVRKLEDEWKKLWNMSNSQLTVHNANEYGDWKKDGLYKRLFAEKRVHPLIKKIKNRTLTESEYWTAAFELDRVKRDVRVRRAGKPYQRKEVLERDLKDGLSLREIAKKYGCRSPGTILYQLERLGIRYLAKRHFDKPHRRSPKKKTLARYLKEGLSPEDIAKKYHCSPVTIRENLIKYGLVEKRVGRKLKLSKRLEEILAGQLLGGKSLSFNPGSKRAVIYIQQGSESKDYLGWIFNLLQEHSLEWNGKINEIKGKKGRFYARTYAYRGLVSMREQWYPNGIKRVPEDLKLTPTTLKHWYLERGSIMNGNVEFNVISFPNKILEEDINSLVNKLHKIGMETSSYQKGRVWKIKIKNSDFFFDYVGSCPEHIRHLCRYTNNNHYEIIKN